MASLNHKYKNKQYGQRKRLYGDYLYNQDRAKFNADYLDYCDEHGKVTKKEFKEYLNGLNKLWAINA